MWEGAWETCAPFPVPLSMQAKRIAVFKLTVTFYFKGKLQAGTNSTLKMIKILNSDKLCNVLQKQPLFLQLKLLSSCFPNLVADISVCSPLGCTADWAYRYSEAEKLAIETFLRDVFVLVEIAYIYRNVQNFLLSLLISFHTSRTCHIPEQNNIKSDEIFLCLSVGVLLGFSFQVFFFFSSLSILCWPASLALTRQLVCFNWSIR